MILQKISAAFLLILIVLLGCSLRDAMPPEYYDCQFSFTDSSSIHPRASEYQNFLDTAVKKGFPGAILLIRTPEHGLWIGASGYADIASEVEMKPCNLSFIGSVSKTFVAATVLRLQEEGTLSIDDKVSSYVSASICEEIENADRATIRQLLNHTSGIYNYTKSIKYGTDMFNEPDRSESLEETVAYAYGKDAYFAPGTGFEYSNTNYCLLGLVIGAATGKEHSQVIRETVLEPLGLEKTYYDPQSSSIPDGTVRGYTDFYGDGRLSESTDYSTGHYTPDGGVVSNVYELAKFVEAIFAGDLLDSSSVAQMQEWVEEEDPLYGRSKYGLGLNYWDTPHGYAVGHSGEMFGYLAEMWYFPDKDVTYVMLINGSFGKVNEVVNEYVIDEALNVIFTED
jgi:D-alanyl-D-alanine carboxypeptidase